MGWPFGDDLPRTSADIPRIDGDPSSLRQCATDLRTLAGELEMPRTAASQLQTVTDGTSWQGQGFDSFRSKVDKNPKASDVENAQSIMHQAADVLTTLASQTADAQSRIDWCRTRIDNLDLPAGDIPDDKKPQVLSIKRDADTARSSFEGYMRAAGNRFGELTGKTVYAEPPPGFFERVGDWASAYANFWKEFAIGIVEGVWEMVKGLYSLVALAVQPWKWDEAWATFTQIVKFAWNNPGDFFKMMGKAMVDWDTLMENPGRWLGKLVPAILLAVATGGAGGAAAALGRVATMASRFGRMARVVNAANRAAGVARRVDNFANVPRRLATGGPAPVRAAMGAMDTVASLPGRAAGAAFRAVTGRNAGHTPVGNDVELPETGNNNLGGENDGGNEPDTVETSYDGGNEGGSEPDTVETSYDGGNEGGPETTETSDGGGNDSTEAGSDPAGTETSDPNTFDPVGNETSDPAGNNGSDPNTNPAGNDTNTNPGGPEARAADNTTTSDPGGDNTGNPDTTSTGYDGGDNAGNPDPTSTGYDGGDNAGNPDTTSVGYDGGNTGGPDATSTGYDGGNTTHVGGNDPASNPVDLGHRDPVGASSGGNDPFDPSGPDFARRPDGPAAGQVGNPRDLPEFRPDTSGIGAPEFHPDRAPDVVNAPEFRPDPIDAPHHVGDTPHDLDGADHPIPVGAVPGPSARHVGPGREGPGRRGRDLGAGGTGPMGPRRPWDKPTVRSGDSRGSDGGSGGSSGGGPGGPGGPRNPNGPGTPYDGYDPDDPDGPDRNGDPNDGTGRDGNDPSDRDADPGSDVPNGDAGGDDPGTPQDPSDPPSTSGGGDGSDQPFRQPDGRDWDTSKDRRDWGFPDDPALDAPKDPRDWDVSEPRNGPEVERPDVTPDPFDYDPPYKDIEGPGDWTADGRPTAPGAPDGPSHRDGGDQPDEFDPDVYEQPFTATDGSVQYPDGSIEHPDGSVSRPEGDPTVDRAGDAEDPPAWPDFEDLAKRPLVGEDGSVVWPDGDTTVPDGWAETHGSDAPGSPGDSGGPEAPSDRDGSDPPDRDTDPGEHEIGRDGTDWGDTDPLGRDADLHRDYPGLFDGHPDLDGPSASGASRDTSAEKPYEPSDIEADWGDTEVKFPEERNGWDGTDTGNGPKPPFSGPDGSADGTEWDMKPPEDLGIGNPDGPGPDGPDSSPEPGTSDADGADGDGDDPLDHPDIRFGDDPGPSRPPHDPADTEWYDRFEHEPIDRTDGTVSWPEGDTTVPKDWSDANGRNAPDGDTGSGGSDTDGNDPSDRDATDPSDRDDDPGDRDSDGRDTDGDSTDDSGGPSARAGGPGDRDAPGNDRGASDGGHDRDGDDGDSDSDDRDGDADGDDTDEPDGPSARHGSDPAQRDGDDPGGPDSDQPDPDPDPDPDRPDPDSDRPIDPDDTSWYDNWDIDANGHDGADVDPGRSDGPSDRDGTDPPGRDGGSDRAGDDDEPRRPTSDREQELQGRLDRAESNDLLDFDGEVGDHLPVDQRRGSQKSYLVRFTEGGHDSRAIWKPVSGDFGPRESVPLRGQAAREVATSRVAEDLGFGDLVPPTTRWDRPGEAGSLQHWVEGTTPGRPPGSYSQRDQERMAVLDYVLGNTDRTVGNWRTGPNGEVVAIDNGLTLPLRRDPTPGWGALEHPNPIVSSFVTNHMNRPFSPEMMEHLRSIDPADLRRTMREADIEDEAIDEAMARFDEILENGTITGEAWGGDIYDSDVGSSGHGPAA